MLQRESQVHPNEPVRADPVVDAMGGYVDLTIDRLARVEVRHGAPSYHARTPTLTATSTAAPRDLRPARRPLRPRLHHRPLRQVAAEHGHPGRHRPDDLGDAHVHLLQPRRPPGDRALQRLRHARRLEHAAATCPTGCCSTARPRSARSARPRATPARVTSTSASTPIDPLKVGSFGGSLQIGGGATEAIAEWLDINGDGLPDKVYRDSDGQGGDASDTTTSTATVRSASGSTRAGRTARPPSATSRRSPGSTACPPRATSGSKARSRPSPASRSPSAWVPRCPGATPTSATSTPTACPTT